MQAALFAASFFTLVVVISLAASTALSNTKFVETEAGLEPLAAVDPSTVLEYTLIPDESKITWFGCSWAEFRCN